MPYDHRHLRTFVAVAEELSFRRAALRVGLVQPAVSRTIRDLERRLGVRLLSRSTRLVRLTEAGRVFLSYARDILTNMEKAERLVRAVDAGTQGRLTVAYMDFAIQRLLPTILPHFKRTHPDVRVDLVYMWTDRQRQAILEREADIGFMIGPFTGQEFNSVVVARDPIHVVMPSDHPLAARRSLSLRELANEPFILGTPRHWRAFHRIIDDMFREVGVSPRIVQEASTTPAIIAMISAGLGISLYAGVPEQYNLSHVTLRPLHSPNVEVMTSMIWRIGHRSPFVDRFVKVAQATLDDCFQEDVQSAPGEEHEVAIEFSDSSGEPNEPS